MKSFKLKPIKKPNKMISYWKNQWLIVSVIVITGTFYNVGLAFGPVIQGKIIDFIIKNAARSTITNWIEIFVGIIAIVQIMRYLKRYYVRVFASRTSSVMRMMVYNNIINMDIDKLNKETTGDLMTKAISDVSICVEGMRKFTTEVFDTGVLIVAYFITMLGYDIKLTLIAIIFLPVAMIIADRLKFVIFKYSKEYRLQFSRVSNITNENIENALLYRLNGIEEKKAKQYNEELCVLEKKAVLANMLENSMQPIYQVISMIGIVAIVFWGGKMAIDGFWTVGEFSAYVILFTGLTVKASKAAKLFNSVQKAQVSWGRIKPYLTEYVEKKQPEIKKEKEVELKIKDMSFIYEKEEKPAVSNVNFEIKTGEIVGVTGPIASGKSTIGIAIQGIYPYTGSITINGKELREYLPYEISKKISYMGHDSQLLSDTIYNNITLGEKGDIGQVINDVIFDEDLKSMPDGIETIVGSSGIRLSGGQQSRIALARALYNGSGILVLDDPFSAVDVKTEIKIMENLKKNYQNCAIILISHRITAFNIVDKVLLVNHGETIFGTHKELMETSKIYKAINKLQKECKEDED